MEDGTLLWQHQIMSRTGKVKTLSVRQGDLCKTEESYDVLVCSAFKGDYAPTSGSLIGALSRWKGIPVEKLAKTPELDLKMMGCWLSKEILGNFRRIACVELLDPWSLRDVDCKNEIMLKSAFSTLRYMLEQASIRGIPVRTVALPVLGTGDQGIELYYIAGPLLNQCIQALETIDGLEVITFYERNGNKAQETADMLRKTLAAQIPQNPQVFISYRSSEEEIACQMRDAMQRQGYACWMAPDSIPAGSDYQEEIAGALRQVSVVALLLTPQAEQSRWVSKEVGVAIGNGHAILPYQPYDYPLSEKFRFLLEGAQIIRAWNYSQEEGLSRLTGAVRQHLEAEKV